MAFVLASAGSIFAAVGSPVTPLSMADDLKKSVFETVMNQDEQSISLEDATIDVEIVVNPEGDLAIVSIDGKVQN